MKRNVPTNYLINWIGGKRLLRKQIASLIPEDIESYIEPFGGGAWVLFYKEKWADLEVYNDADARLVNLFRCVKYHPDALIKEYEWMFGSRLIFKQTLNSTVYTDIQKAAKFLYILNRSFGAKMTHFGFSRKKRAYTSHSNIMLRISAIAERLDKVLIENLDFKEIIKLYDHEKSFMYLDPPYTEGEGYATTTTKDFVHEELAGCLKKIKGRFLLSYNDSPQVREFYKDFYILETTRKNILNNQSKSNDYKELLIANYNILENKNG